jgi:hypothetical protein
MAKAAFFFGPRAEVEEYRQRAQRLSRRLYFILIRSTPSAQSLLM